MFKITVAMLVVAIVNHSPVEAAGNKPRVLDSSNSETTAYFRSGKDMADQTRLFYCELTFSSSWREAGLLYRLSFTYGLRFPPVSEKQVPIHFLSSFLSKTDAAEVETVIEIKKAYVGTRDDNTLAKEIKSHENNEFSAFTRFDNPSVFAITGPMSEKSRLKGYALTTDGKIYIANMDFSATESGMPGDATHAQSFAKCVERVMYQAADRQ